MSCAMVFSSVRKEPRPAHLFYKRQISALNIDTSDGYRTRPHISRLLRWLPLFAKLAPDIAVRGITGHDDDLMDALIEGRAQVGVMYTADAA